jgi:PAS domain S-box-containing protein
MLADDLEGLMPAILTAVAEQLGAPADAKLGDHPKERLPAIAGELVAALRADRLDAKPPSFPVWPDSSVVVEALRALKVAIYDAIEQHQLPASARQMRLIGEYFASVSEAALQAQLRLFCAMLDAIPDAVLLTDAGPRSQYLYLNRTVADNVVAMTGLPREELLGKGIFDLPFPRMFIEQIAEAYERSRRGESVTDEVQVPTPGGGRWFERHARPIFDAEGRVQAVAVASRDIDARKRAEEELAEELAFRERMVGILGHDLRNPVSAVLGLTGLMQLDEGVGEKTRERIALIAQSARRMNEMIATLLDFTHLRFRGDLHLERAPIDLGEVARDVVDELRAAHPRREIRLSAPREVRGEWDAARMAQLLCNLVANALTHGAPESAVDIELSADEAAVALSVKNQGATIPADAMARLFEPFYQLGQVGEAGQVGQAGQAEDTTLRPHGLGLGLYIVRAIVDAHGGAVEVGSADGLTSFTVRLPRHG